MAPFFSPFPAQKRQTPEKEGKTERTGTIFPPCVPRQRKTPKKGKPNPEKLPNKKNSQKRIYNTT